MNIYTKAGDTGHTSLIGGKRVAKNHPRVEAYGQVDELIAAIGVVRAYLTDATLEKPLLSTQEHLMTLAAHLASEGGCSFKSLPPVEQKEITDLEQQMDRMQERLPPLTSFVLPGPPVVAAHCHAARTVCRRAERAVVALGSNAVAPEIVRYLNRLSDFLFVLSRYTAQEQGAAEGYWTP